MSENSASIVSLRETHAKCPRCKHMHLSWGNFGHLKSEIKSDPKLAKEKLCQRCSDVIVSQNPDHPSVNYIKLFQEKEKEYYKKTGGYIDTFEKITLWEL